MRILWILLLIVVFSSFSNGPLAYKFYDADGEKATFEDVLKEAAEADVVFFGEHHNNPVCHWLRQEILQELHENNEKKLVLGAEMFERDNQQVLDEYMNGWISENRFEEESKLWPNYHTDYRPMTEWAKAEDIPLIATNIPRRYASMVAQHGKEFLDTLPENTQHYMTPLPFETDLSLRSYEEMMEMAGSHGSADFIHAQAIKDATMAFSISENFDPKNQQFFHVNGAYHTIYREGIVHYLENYFDDLNAVVITTIEQEKAGEPGEDDHEKGDFILVIPENMTKTH